MYFFTKNLPGLAALLLLGSVAEAATIDKGLTIQVFQLCESPSKRSATAPRH